MFADPVFITPGTHISHMCIFFINNSESTAFLLRSVTYIKNSVQYDTMITCEYLNKTVVNVKKKIKNR